MGRETRAGVRDAILANLRPDGARITLRDPDGHAIQATAPAAQAAPSVAALASAVTRAYALALRLGEVQRATFHADGTTPETDTTHTVGLQLVCLQVAPAVDLALGVYLSRAKLLTYALVHDLVEAYAGDVNTLRPLDPVARAEKDRREREALERIRADLPAIAEHVDAYEARVDLEAQVVHYLDKACPRLTHALNGGVTIARAGLCADELLVLQDKQRAGLLQQHPRLEVLDRLLAELDAP